ncbi:MAG: trehalose-phosphatase, partial [Actinobacteria bacterium]|nr:trehalose-phosphatase [Actinomycetota bacterium]
MAPDFADIRRDPSRTGVFADFDGTLSTIVTDPADAQPVGGAAVVLRDLADRYASVA